MYTIKTVLVLFSFHIVINREKLIIWRKRSFIRSHKKKLSLQVHSIQLFNVLFALFLYCVFKSLLCSLNTACHGSWADFVCAQYLLLSSTELFWLRCVEHVPQRLVEEWMTGYYFPCPTHMDLPIRQCTGRICAVCQSASVFVNQECNLVSRLPLVCQFKFLQLNIFHKLKGWRGRFQFQTVATVLQVKAAIAVKSQFPEVLYVLILQTMV